MKKATTYEVLYCQANHAADEWFSDCPNCNPFTDEDEYLPQDQPDWDEGMDSKDGYAEVFPDEPEPTDYVASEETLARHNAFVASRYNPSDNLPY